MERLLTEEKQVIKQYVHYDHISLSLYICIPISPEGYACTKAVSDDTWVVRM